MTEKTLAELRTKTDQLMNSPLHMHHDARIAALAAERLAADFEIERLTREIERLTRELDEARAEVERLRAAAQVLYEALAECVDRVDTFYGPLGSNRIARARAALAKARDEFKMEVRDE